MQDLKDILQKIKSNEFLCNEILSMLSISLYGYLKIINLGYRKTTIYNFICNDLHKL